MIFIYLCSVTVYRHPPPLKFSAWMLPLCLLSLGSIVEAGRNLPDLLMIIGILALLPALKVHTDGKWHPIWGDRIDGRRVRTAPAMEQITANFMPNRNGANNMFSESVEITELERYVRRKLRESLTGFGMSHVIMAACTLLPWGPLVSSLCITICTILVWFLPSAPLGRKRRAEEIKDGEIVERKYVDLKFNLDERICDGFYYFGVIKYFLRILSHPEVLDNPPETIEKDIP